MLGCQQRYSCGIVDVKTLFRYCLAVSSLVTFLSGVSCSVARTTLHTRRPGTINRLVDQQNFNYQIF